MTSLSSRRSWQRDPRCWQFSSQFMCTGLASHQTRSLEENGWSSKTYGSATVSAYGGSFDVRNANVLLVPGEPFPYDEPVKVKPVEMEKEKERKGAPAKEQVTPSGTITNKQKLSVVSESATKTGGNVSDMTKSNQKMSVDSKSVAKGTEESTSGTAESIQKLSDASTSAAEKSDRLVAGPEKSKIEGSTSWQAGLGPWGYLALVLLCVIMFALGFINGLWYRRTL